MWPPSTYSLLWVYRAREAIVIEMTYHEDTKGKKDIKYREQIEKRWHDGGQEEQSEHHWSWNLKKKSYLDLDHIMFGADCCMNHGLQARGNWKTETLPGEESRSKLTGDKRVRWARRGGQMLASHDKLLGLFLKWKRGHRGKPDFFSRDFCGFWVEDKSFQRGPLLYSRYRMPVPVLWGEGPQ